MKDKNFILQRNTKRGEWFLSYVEGEKIKRWKNYDDEPLTISKRNVAKFINSYVFETEDYFVVLWNSGLVLSESIPYNNLPGSDNEDEPFPIMIFFKDTPRTRKCSKNGRYIQISPSFERYFIDVRGDENSREINLYNSIDRISTSKDGIMVVMGNQKDWVPNKHLFIDINELEGNDGFHYSFSKENSGSTGDPYIILDKENFVYIEYNVDEGDADMFNLVLNTPLSWKRYSKKMYPSGNRRKDVLVESLKYEDYFMLSKIDNPLDRKNVYFYYKNSNVEETRFYKFEVETKKAIILLGFSSFYRKCFKLLLKLTGIKKKNTFQRIDEWKEKKIIEDEDTSLRRKYPYIHIDLYTKRNSKIYDIVKMSFVIDIFRKEIVSVHNRKMQCCVGEIPQARAEDEARKINLKFLKKLNEDKVCLLLEGVGKETIDILDVTIRKPLSLLS